MPHRHVPYDLYLVLSSAAIAAVVAVAFLLLLLLLLLCCCDGIPLVRFCESGQESVEPQAVDRTLFRGGHSSLDAGTERVSRNQGARARGSRCRHVVLCLLIHSVFPHGTTALEACCAMSAVMFRFFHVAYQHERHAVPYLRLYFSFPPRHTSIRGMLCSTINRNIGGS